MRRAVVLFSTGAGLEAAERQGYLSREAAYYTKWSKWAGRVALVVYGDVHKERTYQAELRPLEVHPLPCRSPTVLSDVEAVFRHRSLLRRSRFIKADQVRAGLVGAAAKWIWGVPLIVRCGFVPTLFFKHAGSAKPGVFLFRRFTEFLAFRAADAIIVSSEEAKRHVCRRYGIARRKITVVGNAIDTQLFRPLDDVREEPNTVLYVGRLSEEKNVASLIRALERSGLRLVVYGSGHLQRPLSSLAHRLGVDVRWMKRVANDALPRVYNEAGIYSLVSYHEGSPKTLLEAMACGCCVVVTPAPGIRNIVRNNYNGIVCGSTSPEDIREGLARAARDAELRRELGNQARKDICRDYEMGRLIERERCAICAAIGKDRRTDREP